MSRRGGAKGNKISKEQNCKSQKESRKTRKQKTKMIELFNPQVCVRTASANLANQNPIPHCKQLGVKLATLPSSGGLNPRGSCQMSNPTFGWI